MLITKTSIELIAYVDTIFKIKSIQNNLYQIAIIVVGKKVSIIFYLFKIGTWKANSLCKFQVFLTQSNLATGTIYIYCTEIYKTTYTVRDE